MPVGEFHLIRAARSAAIGLAAMVALLASSSAQAQQFQNTRGVGGVIVDPAGMLVGADVDARSQLRQQIAEALQTIPEGLDQPAAMRKISLRRLEAAVRECVEAGKHLPDSILFLGGLQKIDYVLVLPDDGDILLIGPADGWKAGGQGAVVGVTTGRPVMLLDDLVVALRSANAPTKSVISCSIDPTPEGLSRLRGHASRLRTIGNPQATASGIEGQLGPQKISVTGVPDTSHLARVMVAADYRMKRVSMDLDPAPIPRFPSFLDMMKATGRGMSNMLPRWWLAPDYEPLLRDADGLAWQVRGAAVKAMAENDFLDAAGIKHETGRADPVSQRWADTMTERYEELAMADPIFGQLRNCMDLAIVAALIVKENLLEKAGLSLPILMSPDGLQTAQLTAPRQVASKASLVHKGRKWLIACGGVEINPWQIVGQTEQSDSLAALRRQATFDSGRWWSD